VKLTVNGDVTGKLAVVTRVRRNAPVSGLSRSGTVEHRHPDNRRSIIIHVVVGVADWILHLDFGRLQRPVLQLAGLHVYAVPDLELSEQNRTRAVPNDRRVRDKHGLPVHGQ
jgi:hypothetical protein